MTRLRYATGYLAAILDEAGAIRLRNAVSRIVRRDSNFHDGFDAFFAAVGR